MHVYLNYYKKFSFANIKKKNCLVNMRMINLSFHELNISLINSTS